MKPKANPQTALEHYRRALGPDPGARERALRDFAQRLALGEQPELLARAPDPPQLPKWPVSGNVLLLIGAASVLGVLGIAGAWLSRPQLSVPQSAEPHAAAEPVSSPPSAAPASPTDAALGPVSPLENSNPVLPSVHPESARARAVPRRATPRSRALSAERAERAEVPPAADAPAVKDAPAIDSARAEQSDLAEEVRLMGLAHDALRGGQPERALAWLAEHAARFPNGALAQSRQMTHIMALCQAGRSSAARAEAKQFLEVPANSPYAARVRAICRDPE